MANEPLKIAFATHLVLEAAVDEADLIQRPVAGRKPVFAGGLAGLPVSSERQVEDHRDSWATLAPRH